MFNLKKIVSAVIAGAMIFSTLPMAYAEPDPVLFSEDFEGTPADRIGHYNGDGDAINSSGAALENGKLIVTRGSDHKYGAGFYEFVTEDGNQYMILKDKYNDYEPNPNGGDPYNYMQLNVLSLDNVNTDLTGRFAVETKFQIPELRDGARFYPISAFYTEADLNRANGYSRGELAKFVYVEKDGDNFVFKYSNHVPANTAETTETRAGATLATAEAGKWYTLKLIFNIDGNAETIDRFTYELSDGTDIYSGNGGAVGNGVGVGAWSPYTPDYNLTALHKVVFGYVWDQSTTSVDDPTSIYIDDASIRNISDATPITLVSSSPAANAEDFAADGAIELTFSGAITEASAQNIKITPAVEATITADGNTVTITPDNDLPYGERYTVTIPNTLVNPDGAEVISTSLKFKVQNDPDVLLYEDFEGDMTGVISTDRTLDFTVSRVQDLGDFANHYEIKTEAGNKFIELKDIYGENVIWNGNTYNYGRYNVVMEHNQNMNLTGEFVVETKFQIPSLVAGAKYYPITGFYNETDLTGAATSGWNRGKLARFAYVVKDGENFVMKVSNYVPEDINETEEAASDEVIATVEAGKWYTLKLNFNVDGDATTIDRFTYELTDGTNTYSGLGGAVGNGVGTSNYPYDPHYNLTSLYKLAFGYIWDETVATETTPDSIYLDDISIRREAFVMPAAPIELVSSVPAANATDVAANASITLTFSEAVTNVSAQNITISPAVEATITADGATVTIDPATNLAFGTTYTVTVPETVVNEAGTAVTATTFSFATEQDPDELYAEDFEGETVADRVGTGDKALKVTGVSNYSSSALFGFATENDNQYLVLKDPYNDRHLETDGNTYDYYHLNVISLYNVNTDLTGDFAVETKFQIPELREGARFYPITGFYNETDMARGNYNRGELAKFVYVEKDGDNFVFKYSDYIPSDITETTETRTGATIATAEAGKWYTLKLNFNIDGNTETIDRFTYELSDGTNTYSGLGGAVGNGVGTDGWSPYTPNYNLTALHKVAFGFVWDRSTTSASDPTSIYLDDLSIRREAFAMPAAPIELVSSVPAANATDVAANASITLTFSEAVTNASAQNITISPAVEATITADGATVTIDPATNLAFGTTYTVTVPETVANEEGTTATATSFSFTTAADPDELLSEDFEGDMTGVISTDRTLDFTVSRVNDLGDFANHYEIKTEAGNKFIELKDIYGENVIWNGNTYNYGRYNVVMEHNQNMNLTGEFAVETKFQIPSLVDGAKYYPITGFYNETDLTGAATNGWNRGKLARFAYVVKDGENFVMKVSNYVPEDINETEEAASDEVIATVEAGKWYTLKLNFNVDGDATTIDRFTYTLTDGTDTYTGNGGAVGNGVGTSHYPYDPHYNLTSLYKLAFGYIWDETVATETTPDSIYLDDISIRNEEFPLIADPEDPDTPVDPDPEDPDTPVDPDPEDPDPVDPDLLFAEDFEGTPADRIGYYNGDGNAINGSGAALENGKLIVTRGSDNKHGAGFYEFVTEDGNQYMILKDKYNDYEPNPNGGDPYNYMQLNVLSLDNVNTDLTGRFAVETKFQIPQLRDGARFYPISAFYTEADLNRANGWSRGELAKFVYVEKDGDNFVFKYSNHVPTDAAETTETRTGATIATAEAGKWYTLKLNFNIDGNAETVDLFTYELTDGTNTYTGNGGAVGNGVGVGAWSVYTPDYNLTSIHKMVFGYVWDQSTTSLDDPTSIYIDDASIRRTYATSYTPSVADGATDVDVNSNIVLTFDKQMSNTNIDKVVVYEGDPADKIICQTTETLDAETGKIITIKPVDSFKYGRTYTVVVPGDITDIDGINIDKSQFSFSTETVPADSVTIATPTVTGTVVAGETVSGTATFTKDNYASAEPLTFMAVAYDANGTKVGITYVKGNFAESDDVALNFSFTIPQTAQGTGSIKLMAWDSFANMKPVSGVVTANN